MKKFKESFEKIAVKKGAYSAGLIAVVIGIAIVANLIIGQIPTKYTQLDISDNHLYEITETSTKVLGKLDKDIVIYAVADPDKVDDRISKFLDKYKALSDHVTVKELDPVQNPSVLTDYDTETDTLVVSCKDTDKKISIPFTDIIVSDSSSYMYTGTTTESKFDAEGQLTSAVNYVTNDETTKVYRTAGHGESTFATSLSEMITKSNIEITELNTMMNPTIPEDCQLLIMYAPTTDLTEEEATAYKNYLAAGGKLLVLLGDTKNQSTNLEGILEEYGMKQVDGYIADTQRYYQGAQSPFNIFPVLSLDSTLSEGISSEMVLVSNALGMNLIDPARDTITTTGIMSTSENGYAVIDDNTQTQGTYTLGAVATESISSDTTGTENSTDTEAAADVEDTTDAEETSDTASAAEDTKESRLTVISASTLIDSTITDQFTTLDNQTLFMNLVTANFSGMENVSVAPKSLEVTYNTVQYAGAFSLLAIFGIPLVIIVAGFAVWLKRRKA